jgi:hypothetical protein
MSKQVLFVDSCLKHRRGCTKSEGPILRFIMDNNVKAMNIAASPKEGEYKRLHSYKLSPEDRCNEQLVA